MEDDDHAEHLTSLLDHINHDEFLQGFEEDNDDGKAQFNQGLSQDDIVESLHQAKSNSKPSSKRNSAKLNNEPKTPRTKTTIKSRTSSLADNVAAEPEDSYLAELQCGIEQISSQGAGDVTGTGSILGVESTSHQIDDVLPSTLNEVGSDAIIRFLKAKLRVVQEQVESLLKQCDKKEESISQLNQEVKQLEEERNRLQRTNANHVTQMENYKKLMEDSKLRIEGLETQTAIQRRELEEIKRTYKKENSSHKATDVRLNRALEEMEKCREQLQKTKAEAKDQSCNDKKRIEQLMMENRFLEKQKNELMTGFRKQMKLIDILKKQKMHIEAAKILSFTEEEFIKAMEWEN
ncbi:testis-expressed protein 9-like [Argonauta hians]